MGRSLATRVQAGLAASIALAALAGPAGLASAATLPSLSAFRGATLASAPITGIPSGINPSPDNGTLTFSLSATQAVPGGGLKPVDIDRNSVKIMATPLNGGGAAAPLAPAVGGGASVNRQVMLLLDTSTSMLDQNGTRIEAERAAARTFLKLITKTDINVGVVTFGDPADKVVPPGRDLDAVRRAIDALDPKPQTDTAMFQAVTIAADAMDERGTRSILMISDGKNEDRNGQKFKLPQAQAALGDAAKGTRIAFTGVLVGNEKAQDIFNIAGGGAVVKASNPSQFNQRLQDLVQNGVAAQEAQLSITVKPPPAWAGQTVSFQVVATSNNTPIHIEAFQAAVPKVVTSTSASALPPVSSPGDQPGRIPGAVYFIALIAVFGALAVLLSTATGALAGGDGKESAVIRRLEVYTVAGGTPARVAVTEQTTRLGDSALTRSAVGLMTKLARSSQLDQALDSRLEAAGLPLRTAEWMLLHIGIAVGSALIFLLLTGGKLAAMVVGLLLGLAGPWLFLTLSKSRRERKFLAQLPDTLQLLAGSLAAGYSLPQAMDAVVRESGPPISLEFNRALIEARLGMPPEDALDGIAKRTGSTDFSWIVMAIRIQRDVGGNLAELLSSVADTLRERERLRRQVNALSAEGRLSGFILGALPLVFGLYLMLTRPDYIAPLFDTRMGLLFLAIGAIALIIGSFWMSRVIKVKV